MAWLKVQVIGNVTRDPEVKYTPRGLAVAEVCVAVNRAYQQGEERREEVTFIGVTLWGRLAEVAGEYARKGRSVYIEGRLTQESWEDKKTGRRQTKTKVVGESMQLLGGGGGGVSATAGGLAKESGAGRRPCDAPLTDPEGARGVAAEAGAAGDEDLPF